MSLVGCLEERVAWSLVVLVARESWAPACPLYVRLETLHLDVIEGVGIKLRQRTGEDADLPTLVPSLVLLLEDREPVLIRATKDGIVSGCPTHPVPVLNVHI